MLSAALCLSLVALLPISELKWVSGSFAAIGWTFEITRRIWPQWNDRLIWVFSAVAHPRERFVINSTTWYVTALLALSLTEDPILCTVGVAVLGAGDPIAAVVGRRWGRVRLLYSRTLEGSLAFVAMGTVAAWGLLAVLVPEVPLLTGLRLAALGSVAGAAAELASGRVDDNLSIPLAAAAAAWLSVNLELWI
ncbi:MAG: hypothetical protein JKY37_23525 [Nannocystaceae bacterium]|nr:hypothetical protein [Nannocystaceae bacterium]